MPKPRYKYVNPLIDDNKSLEELFEQAKQKHYAGMDANKDQNNRETKEEKKLRIKKEQLVKHNEYI